jgi:murein DD-endopeptidase MepM/ murein hydrolase activator NlpD
VGSRHTGTAVLTRDEHVAPPSSITSGEIPAATTARPTRARRRMLARRRPDALLAALVVGGVTAAAVIGTQSFPVPGVDEPLAVAEQLGTDAEGLLEVEPVSAQGAITEVEAKARLAQVAATRAERAAAAEAAEAAAAAAAEAARPKAVLPVEGARLTSCFCERWGTMHWGIDLAAPMLTPEHAAEDGVVLRAGAASGYGLAVYILGVSGDVTIYGHMEKIQVEAGDVVSAGDQIALLGNRGQSTGPHLHFEVHQGGLDGKRIDPEEWLRERGVDI